MNVVEYQDLGTIEYQKAWDYQTELFEANINAKIRNRKFPEESQEKAKNYLLFCEHPHVYTLGKSGDQNNLLIGEKELGLKSATYVQTNRGGDITYHGPGQLVGYPIFDLECFFTDIYRYMRCLEEAVILTLKEFGINAERSDGETGVWLDPNDPMRARKICAMGVKSSRWVTMHGIGFNVNSDLSYFNNIVPCGITNKSVTSMQSELGELVDMTRVKESLKLNFANVFDFDYEI